MLHSATGHGSIRHLYQALKRRNAPKRALELAKTFTCAVCNEKRRVNPRHLASLEPLPPKWHTISADIGHWQHPETHEYVQFMLIIDEGSRFRIARVLSKGHKQQPSAATCLQYIREGWTQYFGNPKCLRLDPAGFFRSQAVQDFCDRQDIYLDIIPGEAHWQIGVCEQAIQGVKETMSRVFQDHPDATPEELLSTSVRIFNQRDLVRGFSPQQHAFGRGADATGRLVDSACSVPDELQIENPEKEFERNIQRQASAEKAHSEWQASQRLLRAQHSRGRPVLNYVPGDLVYFWRTQESGQSKKATSSKRGRFLGPARVLATETRRSETGELRPGSAVWLVRGRQLLKCAPEQLRPASSREELVEALAEDKQVPWTYTRVAEQIGGNQFEDISDERPSSSEWCRAQDATEEDQPARFRIRTKRPEECPGPEDMEDTGSAPSQPAQRQRLQEPEATSSEAGVCWWTEVAEEDWPLTGPIYWADEAAAVAVEIPLPESQRGLQKVAGSLESFFVSAMKKRAVEVCERKLSPEDWKAFQGAKAIEVKNFIAAQAFEALPDHLIRPSKQQAVNMRWVLTWKTKDDGSKKPKARAVLLGFQDPGYEHRATTAPVMTRQSRQLLLHMSATHRWKVFKGDVSGAFLQGREYPGDLCCIPCKEILAEMGLPEGTITKLKKACYGLVDAPFEWYRTVSSFLEELGLERLWGDPCMWIYRQAGQTRGIVSGHVDDFLFAGPEGCSEWQEILKHIKARFQWGDWESGTFVQCGVQIRETSEGFELSQASYVDEHIEVIPLNACRRKEPQAPTTERERTALRATLGALSWHAQQVAPHISADVGLLLSEVNKSTVDTIHKTTQLVQHTKARKAYSLKIHAFDPQEALCLYAWVDAASQNRPDGGSTQGLVIGVGPKDMQQGCIGRVTLLGWGSHRIDRICRSPGAAETLAAVNGEDALYFMRFQLGEILHGCQDARDPDSLVKRIDGCVITDSRNVYDKLETEVLSIKGAERRSNLELISLKEAQQRNAVCIRWVHSEAQLANPLTKNGGAKELELFYKMQHQWRVVEDPERRSARKRRQAGLDPLEQPQQQQSEMQTSESANFREVFQAFYPGEERPGCKRQEASCCVTTHAGRSRS